MVGIVFVNPNLFAVQRHDFIRTGYLQKKVETGFIDRRLVLFHYQQLLRIGWGYRISWLTFRGGSGAKPIEIWCVRAANRNIIGVGQNVGVVVLTGWSINMRRPLVALSLLKVNYKRSNDIEDELFGTSSGHRRPPTILICSQNHYELRNTASE